MRRRTLLLATVGGLTALAGCSEGDGPAETLTTSAGGTAEPTATATPEPTEGGDETTDMATDTPTETATETSSDTPTETPTATPTPSAYDGYLDDVGNFDGSTADRTGQDTVTVTVGAEGNGGAFAFDPPAVRVDPGTTVRWEWTGNGGSHSVTAEDDSFGSGLSDSAGVNFERTFENPGVAKYFCRPHKSLGMKGVVEVAGDSSGDGMATTRAETTTDGATVTTPRTTTSDDFY